MATVGESGIAQNRVGGHERTVVLPGSPIIGRGQALRDRMTDVAQSAS